MQSAHPANLFQSNASLEIGTRRSIKSKQALGSPIYVNSQKPDEDSGAGTDGGKYKILNAVIDSESNIIWTSESSGIIRNVNLSSGQQNLTLLAHKAPVTNLFLYKSSKGKKVLFSAGWDKSINIWNGDVASVSSTATKPIGRKPLLTIHDASTDFIKALHVVDTKEHGPLLLSGGSDKLIRIWHLKPLIDQLEVSPSVTAENALPVPKAWGTFSEHTRAVTCITCLDDKIFTADSMGRIFQLALSIDAAASRAKLLVQRELRGPETTVSCIHAGWTRPAVADDDDDDDDGHETAKRSTPQAQVWVGSHDKTARLFILPDGTNPSSAPTASSAATSTLGRTSKIGPALGSNPPLSPKTILQHGDHVKSILPLHLLPHLHLSDATEGHEYDDDEEGRKALVLTGSADEDVRVFSIDDVNATRNEDVGVKLINTQSGHWHEVEFLGAWFGTVQQPKLGADEDEVKEPKPSWWVVSAGLDGSIRRWPFKEIVKPTPQDKQQENNQSIPANPSAQSAKTVGKSGMTAEEEAELDELMMSDDD
ncbi:unnamed protein product [Sympodiomycopsis kandeliae]